MVQDLEMELTLLFLINAIKVILVMPIFLYHIIIFKTLIQIVNKVTQLLVEQQKNITLKYCSIKFTKLISHDYSYKIKLNKY